MPQQFDLFAEDAARPGEIRPGPPGLAFTPEAVDEATEAEVIARIDRAPLAPFRFGQWTGKRLTCSYGSGYDYRRGALTGAPPLPDWLRSLCEALAPEAGLEAEALVQALLIRYDPGAGIGWHRDRPQYGHVLGLSLGAPCVLRLRRRLDDGFERRSVPLPPRSLYRLSGEARQQWEHSIAPMEHTRWSVTLRTLR